MNITGLTLRQLRVFDAVARHGSLTVAARDLFVTKAAVSVAVKELEAQLGSPLFDRTGNRLRLNACGAQLRPLADDVLSRMAAIEAVFGGEILGGHLRIGASVTIGNHLLPRLLAAYAGRVTMQPPTVTIANTAHLATMLARYDLDVAFIEGSTHGAALDVEPLWCDRIVVIAAPGHRLADGRVHAMTDLSGERWVLREPDSGTREQFARRLEPGLGRWTLGAEFNSNEAIVTGVAAGLGLGFLSEFAVADAIAAGRIKAVPLDTSHDRSLDAATVPGKFQSPLLRDFLGFCRAWEGLRQG